MGVPDPFERAWRKNSISFGMGQEKPISVLMAGSPSQFFRGIFSMGIKTSPVF